MNYCIKTLVFIVCFLLLPTLVFAQNTNEVNTTINNQFENKKLPEKNHKMKIEIWSDVVCPFCYIGKRNFETALNQFADSSNLIIEWKSFQLDPSMQEQPPVAYDDYMIGKRGFAKAQVDGMLANVTQTAKNVGLDYQLEKSQLTNTFNAHRLIQFAKEQGKGDAMEEILFKAFFTEGKNIGDVAVLTSLGKEIGLNEQDISKAFNNEVYAQKVQFDIREAQQIGVTGVPFFVIDRKYAVSGAQPPQAFLETLQKAFPEWSAQNSAVNLEVTKGVSCSIDGVCE